MDLSYSHLKIYFNVLMEKVFCCISVLVQWRTLPYSKFVLQPALLIRIMGPTGRWNTLQLYLGWGSNPGASCLWTTVLPARSQTNLEIGVFWLQTSHLTNVIGFTNEAALYRHVCVYFLLGHPMSDSGSRWVFKVQSLWCQQERLVALSAGFLNHNAIVDNALFAQRLMADDSLTDDLREYHW